MTNLHCKIRITLRFFWKWLRVFEK